MRFINILKDFCKEMQIYIDFTTEKIEFYENEQKVYTQFVSTNPKKNRTSIMGMRATIEHYSKNDIIFAILQSIGFKKVLTKPDTEFTQMIETTKFLVEELNNVCNGNISLYTQDFQGRSTLNMISEMLISNELMGDDFNPELYINKIFNHCVDQYDLIGLDDELFERQLHHLQLVRENNQ